MTATCTKLTTHKTPDQMRAILEASAGKLHAEPHPMGYEVRDLRAFAERLENPIHGRGVLKDFGDEHFILSATYAAKLGLA